MATRKKNAWFYGENAPVVGQEWANHNATCSWEIEHVKTLEVHSCKLLNGRKAFLCRVAVLSTEPKPENITELKRTVK